MFMSELKNLDGLNLSDVGRGLKETFDLLNVNRLHTGVDNYGLVRFVIFNNSGEHLMRRKGLDIITS